MTIVRLALASGFLAALSVSAHAKIERTVEKKFSVHPGGTLHLETSGGNIEVRTSNEPVVRIIARERINADSEADADELLEKLTLTLEQTGNNVTAFAKYASRPLGFGFRFKSWPPVHVDFIVTAPASFANDVKTSGGNIVIGDFAATVRARTSGGNITLGKIAGPVDASTSGGNVSLEEGAATVKLRTSGGHIMVGRAGGDTDLNTSGGNIRIDAVENTVHATTSGGNVTAGFRGAVKGDSELKTSGGNVTAALEKTASFRLDASTSGGRVNAEGLTLTLGKSDKSRDRLEGDVNGGGALLKLRSSGGNISIQAR